MATLMLVAVFATALAPFVSSATAGEPCAMPKSSAMTMESPSASNEFSSKSTMPACGKGQFAKPSFKMTMSACPACDAGPSCPIMAATLQPSEPMPIDLVGTPIRYWKASHALTSNFASLDHPPPKTA